MAAGRGGWCGACTVGDSVSPPASARASRRARSTNHPVFVKFRGFRWSKIDESFRKLDRPLEPIRTEEYVRSGISAQDSESESGKLIVTCSFLNVILRRRAFLIFGHPGGVSLIR